MRTPRALRRIAAILRYAWKLWKNESDAMPLTIEILTSEDVALLQRQADIEGTPLEHWARNHLLAGVSPAARAQVAPHLAPSLNGALRSLDAVDLAFGDDDAVDPSGTMTEGASTIFGTPPVRGPEPGSEAHARVKGTALGNGPLATSGQVDGHPCRHLARRYLANFNANDCQGTCESKKRGESVCTWPAGAARNCAYFEAKRLPVPPPSPMPRQG